MSVRVTDLLGRDVPALADAPQSIGVHESKAPMSNLAAGVYLVAGGRQSRDPPPGHNPLIILAPAPPLRCPLGGSAPAASPGALSSAS